MQTQTLERLGRTWLWPAADFECQRVVFDTTSDLEHAYQHVRKFEVAVQAGGNMGVWPWTLAKRFERVYTFEADPQCYPFLVQNLAGTPNVFPQNKALSNTDGFCTVITERQRNMGAQFIKPAELGIPTTTIDGLGLQACDLIYLDIEGAELLALNGAYDTIAAFRPVIAVEDKGLSTRFGSQKGDIEQWLAVEFGYKVVARPHRDVVLVCE